MFITPVMIEPTTASLAVYLLTKTTKVKMNIIKKEPLHYKRKLCKWINKNKHDIVDIGIEEFGDIIFNGINNIHITPHPSIFLICYSLLLFIIIIL